MHIAQCNYAFLCSHCTLAMRRQPAARETLRFWRIHQSRGHSDPPWVLTATKPFRPRPNHRGATINGNQLLLPEHQAMVYDESGTIGTLATWPASMFALMGTANPVNARKRSFNKAASTGHFGKTHIQQNGTYLLTDTPRRSAEVRLEKNRQTT